MKRAEAIEQGLPRYNGKPCSSCGNTEKFVSSYGCTSCTKKRTRERDNSVYNRYIKSEKGQLWLKKFRNSETNKQTQNRYNRKRYLNSPEIYLRRTLKQNYNITLEEYQQLYHIQKGCCFICGRPQKDQSKRMAVDHCHKTGRIRKLLCTQCNVALGMVNESVDILKNMIEYIQYDNLDYE